MIKTPLGMLTISLAATIDAIAWCALAVIIAIAKAGSLYEALFPLFAAVIFILMMFYLVRPFLQKIISSIRVAHYGDSNIIALALIILLFSAFLAELIGIHMLFGAFLAGVMMPPMSALKEKLTAKIEDISTHLFLPVFFALTGLRLQMGLLNSSFLIMTSLMITALAIIGKFAGTAIPARLLGISWQDSLRLGALLNTRGLMGAVVLNIGYELGILSQELFAMLMLMALLTTLITCPLLDWLELIFNSKRAV
jgi:Kef-type K+ transport system membrane component KefB